MKKITVFTATYNRAYILPVLYKSLLEQTSKDFEWIVVDDGSDDNTQNLLEKWKQEDFISIIIITTTNGGKQRAINKGINKATGELFLIVDSDDYLIPSAIEIINNDWEKFGENKISGICYKKAFYKTNTPIGRDFPVPPVTATSLEMIYKYKSIGDKAEIFCTEIFRKFLFPEIDGETFIPEAYIWNKITNELPIIFINKCIYMCEYLSDGLTENFKKNIKRNPQGFSLYYRDLLNYEIVPFRDKIKVIIRLFQCKIYQISR
ncbi:sugar transferase [Spirochaetia bacterium]|nr:sugar transferase [Spirochaetia bacterium]